MSNDLALKVLMFNIIFVVLWFITLYFAEIGSIDEISELEGVSGVGDIGEILSNMFSQDYNLGIFNSVIVIYLTISTIIATYIIVNPLK